MAYLWIDDSTSEFFCIGLALIALSSVSISLYAAGGPFFKTEPCPAGQSGLIYYRNDSTSTPAAGRWSETSRTCVNIGPTIVSTGSESQSSACPASTPLGSIIQTRNYTLWSNGTKDYSAWVTSSSTCKAIPTTQTTTTPSSQTVTCATM